MKKSWPRSLVSSKETVLVADTGPLIALAGIGQLELLHQLYDAVLVPQPVHDEVLAGGTNLVGLEIYRQTDWLEVVEIEANDPSLLALLDEGEASVIVLAQERRADVVLIDEQKARKVARTLYGLKVIGSVRILLKAKQKGLLSDIKSAFTAIRDNGYYLHDSIVDYALREAGEADST